jgi:hypothetical protein
MNYKLKADSTNENETLQASQSCSPYSLTRNSFSSSVARSSTVISSHRIHNKNGSLTRYALSKGYIQISPHYPDTHLYLKMENDVILIRGYKEGKTRKTNKEFTSIVKAREYLKVTR